MRYVGDCDSYKVKWQGKIESIQPRTRVWRYVTDNRTHYHIGYNLFIIGESEEEKNEFSLAISEKQYQKGQFRIGDIVKGTGWTKKYPKREYADYYRVAALKLIDRNSEVKLTICPWTGPLPEMNVYEERGAKMLCKSSWKGK